MRILIVEDEARLAETLRQLMEDQRYQADTVGGGADGAAGGLEAGRVRHSAVRRRGGDAKAWMT